MSKLVWGVVAGLGLGAVLGASSHKVLADNEDTYRQLDLFADVLSKMRENYVEPIETSKVIDAAINGMLQSLDPHSSYMAPDEFGDFQTQMKGEFGGLGIEVTMENGFVKVVSPIDDTPASRAGLKAGDFISHIDGNSVMGMALNEAVEKMRGAPGTTIKITIVRQGETKPFDVTLTRAVITVASAKWRVEGNIGYVRLTQFTEQTAAGLEKAHDEFQKKLGNKLQGVVLDLRNNPGGSLDQAVRVTDDFLTQGEIVSVRGRNPKDIQRMSARAGELFDGKPVVVLINGGSASASEIVAGALQDQRRAIILGTKSFGKGSVQTIIPLGPSKGALRLTTARYYTPSGRSIQAKGIDPDIEVKQPADEKADAAMAAFMRSEASLRRHLKGQQEDDLPVPPDDKPAPQVRDLKGKDGKDPEDYQLAYALDLIRSAANAANVPAAAAAKPAPVASAPAAPAPAPAPAQ